MKIRTAIVFGLTLTCSGSFAEIAKPQLQGDMSHSVAIYAPGTASCGTWLDAREAHKNGVKGDVRFYQFEAFLLGFATAYNTYTSSTTTPLSILKDVDAEGQYYYLDKYCRDNPTHVYFYAVRALLDYLRSQQH